MSLAIILGLGVSGYLNVRHMVEANKWVVHTEEVHDALEQVVSLHKDAETGQRGYVLTGEEHYLEPYTTARRQIAEAISRAKVLTLDNGAQQAAIAELEKLSAAQLTELEQTIDLRQKEGEDAARAVIKTDNGQRIMDDLRRVIQEMQTREDALLAKRNRLAESSAVRATMTMAVWTPLALLVLGVAGLLVLKHVKLAEAAEAPLEQKARAGSAALRYGFAGSVVVAGLLLRFALVEHFGPMPAFITLYPAVLAAASLAGGGPGIFATVLSALLASYYIFEPRGSLVVHSTNDLIAVGIFTGCNLFLSLLAERVARTRRVEALAKQRELFAVTLASIGDAVIVTDTNGRVTFMNGEAERLTGWQHEEGYGKGLTEVFRIVNEDSRQVVESPAEKVLRLGTVVGLANHTILLAKDGRETPIDDSGAPVRDRLGKVHGVVLVFRDFSEQKQAELALRESERRYSELFKTMRESLFVAEVITDERGKPVDWRYVETNPPVERLMGFAPDGMIGKRYGEVAQRPSQEWIEMVGQVALTGEAVTREMFAPSRQRWVMVHAYRPRDGQAAVFFSDITERKRVEEDLKAAKISAEQAKQSAETANQAKDRFLAVLSHELRNPLNPILATATMLQRDQRLGAETRELLEVIRRNAMLEARLIDDLLDITRIERGKVELDRRPTELKTVIQRAVEVCMPDIEARGLEFGVDCPEETLVVDVDAARMQQVFWNLLKNSIKFTPMGGCVGIRVRREGTGQVSVEVNDSGEGIGEQALSRIFNAFEQVERSITRQFGGLGLGLTISKGIVEMHGGTIEAESQGKGKGATFRIHLPLMMNGVAGHAPETSAPIAMRALKILLVEDHGDTARVMRQLLRLEGHDVECAGDVATALESARKGKFDLLLSDLGLPDRSGFELMKELRGSGWRAPAIALSGYGQEQDIERSRAAGFAAHLTKPIDHERLAEVMARVVGGDGAPR